MIKSVYIYVFFAFFSVLSSRPLVENIKYDFAIVKMNSIALANSGFGIAVGDDGLIRILNDGFTSSSYYQIPERSKLNKIFSVDENTFFCVGDSGIMYRTTDAGVKWTKMDTKSKRNLNSISFIDNSNGVCIGEYGELLTTTNGGQDWQKQTYAFKNELFDISLIGKTYYACGDKGIVIRSKDSGKNWTKLNTPNSINFKYISAVTENKLYVLGDSLGVMVSEDQGNTFETYYLDSNFTSLYVNPIIDSYFFANKDSGFVKLHDNQASPVKDYEYFTKDGGKTWTPFNRGTVQTGLKPAGPTCFAFIDKYFGAIFDANNSLYAVTTVFPQITYEKLQIYTSLVLQNISSGGASHIAMAITTGDPTAMYVSSNGGMNWNYVPKFDDIGFERGFTNYSHMKMLDSKTILLSMNNRRDTTWWTGRKKNTIIRKYGFVLRSTDFGQSWTEYNFNDKNAIGKFSFADDKYGIADFTRQYIYTSDAGNTWKDGSLPNPAILSVTEMLCPVPKYHIIVARSSDSLFKMYFSKNEGQNWDSSLVLPANCDHIKYFNDNNILAYGVMKGPKKGYISLIFETNNGGKNWNKIFESPESKLELIPDGLRYLYASSENIMCGRGTKSIFLTQNNWSNYEKVDFTELKLNESFTDALFLNENELYLTGNNGTLLKIHTDQLPVREDLFVQNDFLISPNPTSDYINVDLSFQRMQESAIEIYNIFGERVLVAQTSSSKQRIDVSALPEGIYFVRIGEKIGKFVVVR